MEKKAAGRTRAAYGVGAVGKDIVYMLVASYIMLYYNTTLGVDSVFLGTMMMAARIFDAANDPFMGVLVEKTHTRWGKFRPWLFIGTVTNIFTIIALFVVPDSVASSQSTLMVWFGVMYVLWGITYTMMDIPFWSMVPALTEAGPDRESLSVAGRSCASVGGALGAVGVPILVGVLGVTTKQGYARTALLVAAVFLVTELFCIFNVRERVSPEQKTPTLRQMFKSLVANDQVVVIVGTIIIFNTCSYITQGLAQYMFKYEYGDFSLFTVFAGVALAAQLAAMLSLPSLRKKHSSRSIFRGALMVTMAGYALMFLVMLFNNYSLPMLGVLSATAVVIFIGFGLATVLTTVFLADTVDYGEWRTGSRNESVTFSMQTFVVKLASAVSAFIVGLTVKALTIPGQNSAGSDILTKASEQPASGLLLMHLVMTLIPLVGVFVCILYFSRRYKLDSDTLATISADLRKKHGED